VTNGSQQPNSSTMFNEYLGIAVGPEGLSVAWNQLRAGVASSTYRRLPLGSLFGAAVNEPLVTWSAAAPLPPAGGGASSAAGLSGTRPQRPQASGVAAAARAAAQRASGSLGAGDPWYGPPLAGLAIAMIAVVRLLVWRRRRRSQLNESS
jgi:hypothetical protein